MYSHYFKFTLQDSDVLRYTKEWVDKVTNAEPTSTTSSSTCSFDNKQENSFDNTKKVVQRQLERIRRMKAQQKEKDLKLESNHNSNEFCYSSSSQSRLSQNEDEISQSNEHKRISIMKRYLRLKAKRENSKESENNESFNARIQSICSGTQNTSMHKKNLDAQNVSFSARNSLYNNASASEEERFEKDFFKKFATRSKDKVKDFLISGGNLSNSNKSKKTDDKEKNRKEINKTNKSQFEDDSDDEWNIVEKNQDKRDIMTSSISNLSGSKLEYNRTGLSFEKKESENEKNCEIFMPGK